MLTPAEEQQIGALDEIEPERSLERSKVHKQNDQLLSVSSIFYINPQNWCVWINGQKFRPNQQEGGIFTVMQVEPDKVILKLHKFPKKLFALGQMEKIDITSGKTIDYYE